MIFKLYFHHNPAAHKQRNCTSSLQKLAHQFDTIIRKSSTSAHPCLRTAFWRAKMAAAQRGTDSTWRKVYMLIRIIFLALLGLCRRISKIYNH